MDTLRIIPLGGLGEVGKNMTLYELGSERILVDAGLAFPRDEHLGVDLVLPDFGYLRDRADSIELVLVSPLTGESELTFQPGTQPGEVRVLSGRGMACVLYEGDNGYCSMVAEVDVHLDTGVVDVTRLVMALDSGQVYFRSLATRGAKELPEAMDDIIAAAITAEIGRTVDNRLVETDGATRAASLIAELV